MVTVVITAHITIDGVLRLPGQVVSLPSGLAANLLASGYAHVVVAGTPPDIIFGSSVIVIGLSDSVPVGLTAGTVVLRRPT